MPITASNEGGSSLEPIPAGMHVARCFGVCDLGTHENKMFNKWTRQVLVQFEIPSERNIGEKDGEAWDKPRLISKTYTLSLHEKANLFGDLVAWRGRAFTDDELDNFDVSKLIGAPCMLNLVHKARKVGPGSYALIQSITPLLKNVEAPEQEMDKTYFSFEDTPVIIPEGLPDWITDKIKESEEYQKGIAPSDVQQGEATSDGQPSEPPPATDNDDIPF